MIKFIFVLKEGAYHKNICKINQHHSVAVLPSASDVETHGSHRLSSTSLDKIKTHSELEDLSCSLGSTLWDS